MTTAEENALILIAEVRAALARGTKHYNRAGKLMTTDKEILECLLDEGSIVFEPVKER